MIDLHVHLLGHRDREANKKNIRAFLDAASSENLKEIGFSDHDIYLDQFNLPLIRETAAEYPDLRVRIGLEVDYSPRAEETIRNTLTLFPFDFVIGSVHEADGWLFDLPEEEFRHHGWDADELYRRYFAIVTRSVKSGLFTTVGHFDLIKIFGVRSKTDVLILADEALTAMAEYGLVLEVNTAGKYKPVGEFYPEKRLLEEAKRRGIALTLGADAHFAQHVGRDLQEACRLLREIGVKTVVGFEGRERVRYSLD